MKSSPNHQTMHWYALHLLITLVLLGGSVSAFLAPNVKIKKSPRLIQHATNTPEADDAAAMDNGSGSSSSKVSLVGDWEELHGNFLLKPPVEQGPPRALLHFLGGAIVGKVPHTTYRYMLERLAAQGYLIVATPYNLSFDHLDTCDIVIERFEKIAPMLARQYGAVPVVGVGHSCGALLQLLITSLFPDTPRAANCLISFNNKPVKDAVPFFDEVSKRRDHLQFKISAPKLTAAPVFRSGVHIISSKKWDSS